MLHTQHHYATCTTSIHHIDYITTLHALRNYSTLLHYMHYITTLYTLHHMHYITTLHTLNALHALHYMFYITALHKLRHYTQYTASRHYMHYYIRHRFYQFNILPKVSYLFSFVKYCLQYSIQETAVDSTSTGQSSTYVNPSLSFTAAHAQ